MGPDLPMDLSPGRTHVSCTSLRAGYATRCAYVCVARYHALSSSILRRPTQTQNPKRGYSTGGTFAHY
jgi:hypothetical protein